MSDGVLSQEEINALLNGGIGGGDSSASEAAPAPEPAPVPPAAPPPSGAGPTTKFTQEDINQLTEVAKLALGATSSVVQMFVNQQNAEIALEQVGRPIPNAVLLGSFAALTGVIKIDSVIKAINTKFSGKIAEKNVKAAQVAYEKTLGEI